jgi:hypothetical protein
MNVFKKRAPFSVFCKFHHETRVFFWKIRWYSWSAWQGLPEYIWIKRKKICSNFELAAPYYSPSFWQEVAEKHFLSTKNRRKSMNLAFFVCFPPKNHEALSAKIFGLSAEFLAPPTFQNNREPCTRMKNYRGKALLSNPNLLIRHWIFRKLCYSCTDNYTGTSFRNQIGVH